MKKFFIVSIISVISLLAWYFYNNNAYASESSAQINQIYYKANTGSMTSPKTIAQTFTGVSGYLNSIDIVPDASPSATMVGQIKDLNTAETYDQCSQNVSYLDIVGQWAQQWGGSVSDHYQYSFNFDCRNISLNPEHTYAFYSQITAGSLNLKYMYDPDSYGNGRFCSESANTSISSLTEFNSMCTRVNQRTDLDLAFRLYTQTTLPLSSVTINSETVDKIGSKVELSLSGDVGLTGTGYKAEAYVYQHCVSSSSTYDSPSAVAYILLDTAYEGVGTIDYGNGVYLGWGYTSSNSGWDAVIKVPYLNGYTCTYPLYYEVKDSTGTVIYKADTPESITPTNTDDESTNGCNQYEATSYDRLLCQARDTIKDLIVPQYMDVREQIDNLNTGLSTKIPFAYVYYVFEHLNWSTVNPVSTAPEIQFTIAGSEYTWVAPQAVLNAMQIGKDFLTVLIYGLFLAYIIVLAKRIRSSDN